MENVNEFLQSDEWRRFQESTGRRTFNITSPQPSPYKGEGKFGFYANIIEHQLPVVGKYFYIPRGPVCQLDSSTTLGMAKLLELAKKNKAGWVRVEPKNSLLLDLIRSHWRVIKAPHDMQPREVFIIDITKPEEQLLAEMKSKTRYNIKLAEKKGVKVKIISNSPNYLISLPRRQAGNQTPNSNDQNTKFYIDKFIELVKITSKRDGIKPHPESYYRKMFETIPAENLKLYVAEYEGKVIAANIVIHYGNTAIYLHGASDNEYRNVMAPYLLQWQAIKDAKKAGFVKYDLGGISTNYEFYLPTGQAGETTKKWQGITRFKTGFSPDTRPIVFPGSYDIIINRARYFSYYFLQRLKNFYFYRRSRWRN